MTRRVVVVVDRASDWRWDQPDLTVQTVDDFLNHEEERHARPVRVINLCRRYRYLAAGYYCSLLAEARGDLPMPTVADIVDLSRRAHYAFALPEFEDALRRDAPPPDDAADGPLHVHIFFGKPDDPRFRRLARAVFDTFRYPLLAVTAVAVDGVWRVRSIKPLGLHRVRGELEAFFLRELQRFTRTGVPRRRARKAPLYDLAILHDPAEALPPSDAAALERFVEAGETLRMDVELIRPSEYDRIVEFDALFIRETTALNHHTFRFARKAEAEGLPVIDDPRSIIRCTNKVYLRELLKAHGVPAPRSLVLDRRRFGREAAAEVAARLGLPAVLKIPDGSFSRGVHKVETEGELLERAEALFADSRLILAQAFVPTPFDWRIGVLAGEPLFACQYFMARKHWQILHHHGDGSVDEGRYRTVPVGGAPETVVELAVRAASLIGDGLYGVDVKELGDSAVVIEVNDNPNIDHGVEDRVLRQDLYLRILREFVRRIEASRRD